MWAITHILHLFTVAHWLQANYDNDSFERKVNLDTCFSFFSWLFSLPTLTFHLWVIVQPPSTKTPSPMTSCPLPLGVSAPFPADLFQNVSFSPRLCCLFYRFLSLCCERLRLLVMEVNLTNLWISPIFHALVFFPFSKYFILSSSVPRFPSSALSLLSFFLFLLIYKSSVY